MLAAGAKVPKLCVIIVSKLHGGPVVLGVRASSLQDRSQVSSTQLLSAGSLRLGEQENQVVLEIRSCPLFRERRLIRSIRLRCCDAFLHNRTGLKRYNLVPRNQDFSTGRGITPFAWTFRTNDKNTEAGNFYWFAPFQKGFDDLERALDKIGRILF